MQKTFLNLFAAALLIYSATPSEGGVQYSIVGQGSGAGADIPRGDWVYSGGLFYGTSQYSNGMPTGTVYRFDPSNGQTSVLHTFDGAAGGGSPSQGLIEGSDGLLYGAAYNGANSLGTLYRIEKAGSNFTTIHTFANAAGGGPDSAPMEASDGKLYGIVGTGNPFLYGGIYSINRNGTGYGLVRAFTGTTGPTLGKGVGAETLIEGPGGLLFGATPTGGTGDVGVIFSIEKDGDPYTLLHQFSPAGIHTCYGGVTLASDGFLYGTCDLGGAFGRGGVFRIATNGSGFEVIHEFTDSDDGYSSFDPLVEGADGYLYGVAFYSTSNNGSVFRLPKSGDGFAVLHRFSNENSDGAQPASPLIETQPGVFFGTSSSGGANTSGTFFRLEATLEKPLVKVSGSKKPVFRGSRLRLRGTASDELGLQRVELATGKVISVAKGTAQWTADIRVKRSVKRVTVRVQSVDNDALKSSIATIRARRVG